MDKSKNPVLFAAARDATDIAAVYAARAAGHAAATIHVAAHAPHAAAYAAKAAPEVEKRSRVGLQRSADASAEPRSVVDCARQRRAYRPSPSTSSACRPISTIRPS